jgi:hypothetical protein
MSSFYWQAPVTAWLLWDFSCQIWSSWVLLNSAVSFLDFYVSILHFWGWLVVGLLWALRARVVAAKTLLTVISVEPLAPLVFTMIVIATAAPTIASI